MQMKLGSRVVLLWMSLSMVLCWPGYAMSTIAEIEQTDAPAAIAVAGSIAPDHWSYKLIQKLVEQTGLDKQEDIVVNGTHPLSRTEMAVLVSDVSEHLFQDSDGFSEKDKAQFEVLQAEYQPELQVLQARIQKVENSVDYLTRQVNQLQGANAGSVHVLNRLGSANLYSTLQVWNTHPFNTGLTGNNVRLRRAEVGIKGDMIKDWHYAVMVDPVRQTGLLKEFYLDFTGIPKHTIRVGQFKPGITYEGSLASGKLDFFERSQIGMLGDIREQGAALLGNWKALDYQVGLYNGSGENTPDADHRTALGGRVTLRPLVGLMDEKKWGRLELGGSFYNGETADPLVLIKARDSMGLEARYVHSRFMLGGEWLTFQVPGSALTGSGWLVQGLYNLTTKIQLATRYDSCDPVRTLTGNTRSQWMAGVNYFIHANSIRIGLDYFLFKDQTGSNQGNGVVLMAQQMF